MPHRGTTRSRMRSCLRSGPHSGPYDRPRHARRAGPGGDGIAILAIDCVEPRKLKRAARGAAAQRIAPRYRHVSKRRATNPPPPGRGWGRAGKSIVPRNGTSCPATWLRVRSVLHSGPYIASVWSRHALTIVPLDSVIPSSHMLLLRYVATRPGTHSTSHVSQTPDKQESLSALQKQGTPLRLFVALSLSLSG